MPILNSNIFELFIIYLKKVDLVGWQKGHYHECVMFAIIILTMSTKVANVVQPSEAAVVRSFNLDSISDHCVHPERYLFIYRVRPRCPHITSSLRDGRSFGRAELATKRPKVSEPRFLSSRKRQRRLSRRRKPRINHVPWIYEETLLLAILQTGWETRKPSRWTMIDRSHPRVNL